MKLEIPRVLIGAPTSDRHAHLLEDWIKSLDSFTYPNFDVLLVDTTEKADYFKKLKKQKVHNKLIKVIRKPWDYKKDHILQHLAYSREEIRQYFLKNNYDFLFFLDDDIFLPKYSIQKLLSADKDCVGFYVHIYNKENHKPALFKSGSFEIGKALELFDFEEIDFYKDFVKKFRENKLNKQEKLLVDFLIKEKFKPDLLKVYAVGIGCLMIKKKVLEEVPFRTHRTFIWGEDLWFFNEANDKRFEFWCDTSVRGDHRNTNWYMITEKCQFGTKMFVMIGPIDAKEAIIVDPDKKERKWKKLQL